MHRFASSSLEEGSSCEAWARRLEPSVFLFGASEQSIPKHFDQTSRGPWLSAQGLVAGPRPPPGGRRSVCCTGSVLCIVPLRDQRKQCGIASKRMQRLSLHMFCIIEVNTHMTHGMPAARRRPPPPAAHPPPPPPPPNLPPPRHNLFGIIGPSNLAFTPHVLKHSFRSCNLIVMSSFCASSKQ